MSPEPIGVIGLTFVAPPLAEFALKFGPPEYFSLTLLGLLMATLLGGDSVFKGLIMVVLGLLLGSVGLDPISGAIRFTWGFHMLQEGIDFVTLAMGMFGIGEIFYNLEKVLKTELVTGRSAISGRACKDWADSKWAVVRGSLIGFLIGILPGGGAVISSLVSYAVEKRVAKHPEEFGKGAIQGVAGPESANNAAASASFIPLLTLGIPGNAAIAMIFAALLIQGVTPGPFLITEKPDVFWGVVASMYIGNVMLLILNLPLVGIMGPAAAGSLFDPGPHHRAFLLRGGLQRPQLGLRYLGDGDLRRDRLFVPKGRPRAGPPDPGLCPRPHPGEIDAPGALDVRRQPVHLLHSAPSPEC